MRRKYDLDPDRCPADPGEVADDYCRDQLTPEEAHLFEQHYIVCPRCAAEVQRTQLLIDALKQFPKED